MVCLHFQRIEVENTRLPVGAAHRQLAARFVQGQAAQAFIGDAPQGFQLKIGGAQHGQRAVGQRHVQALPGRGVLDIEDGDGRQRGSVSQLFIGHINHLHTLIIVAQCQQVAARQRAQRVHRILDPRHQLAVLFGRGRIPGHHQPIGPGRVHCLFSHGTGQRVHAVAVAGKGGNFLNGRARSQGVNE